VGPARTSPISSAAGLLVRSIRLSARAATMTFVTCRGPARLLGDCLPGVVNGDLLLPEGDRPEHLQRAGVPCGVARFVYGSGLLRGDDRLECLLRQPDRVGDRAVRGSPVAV
jgi:hypothetical protein